MVKFCAFKALLPIAVELLPKTSVVNEPLPTATLKSASVRASPAITPTRVFDTPDVKPAPER